MITAATSNRRWPEWRPWIGLTATLAFVGGIRADSGIAVSEPRALGKGVAVVLRPAAAVEAPSGDLVIHFHGAVETVRRAMERAGTTATVVVVNQPGLSAAYAAPVRDDPHLFDRLLAEPQHDEGTDDEAKPPRWRRVTLSSFSAGYGAVREILKDPTAFGRIDAIVAADSIYAGLDEAIPPSRPRQADPRDMAEFLAFAREATRGTKVFVITHSSLPTPYASTAETADYLIGQLGMERQVVARADGDAFPQTSLASRGGFTVLGFAGDAGPAHLFHLRSLDRWWRLAETPATERPDDRRPPAR